jgi:predicted ATP-dependent endonuclease of OLD family
MQLVRARIQNYKSIDDSGWVTIDEVTALVGKNESGKTAFLQGLARLNPVAGQTANYDVTLDYPRKRLNRYKREHDKDPAVVAEAVYRLTTGEIGAIENAFGNGCLVGRTDHDLAAGEVMITKNYKNQTEVICGIDHQAVIAHLIAGAELPAAVAEQLGKANDLQDFRDQLEALGEDPPQAAVIVQKIATYRSKSVTGEIYRYIRAWQPQFFYFDDYSIMEGRIAVPHLKQKRDNGQLDDADRTFLALINFVGAELEEFESEDNYERLKADLEAASNEISDELFQFWSQNKQLSVEFDLSGPDPSALPPLNAGTNLHVRINNQRHRVTVPFDQRSRGFVWFFSFLAYFSEIEREADSNRGLVLLLDEPGLNLHATAQWDFLRFIDERLADKARVIYSTHSPFMIEPTKLEGVRTVVDDDTKGTIVSDDIFRADKETVFPLQAALGYDLAQTLFVSPDNLLVEGASDLLYLQILSDACAAAGRTSLDARWSIVPVGGIDKIVSFVSLLGGQKLNTSVLIDVSSRDQQRIQTLQDSGHLDKHGLIQVGEITNSKEADIEDLFDTAFYLQLVNGAYKDKLGKKLTQTALSQHPRIAKRIQAYFDAENLGHFSHLRPARHLLREKGELIDKIPTTTLDRAEQLFDRINKTLSERRRRDAEAEALASRPAA